MIRCGKDEVRDRVRGEIRDRVRGEIRDRVRGEVRDRVRGEKNIGFITKIIGKRSKK